MNNQLQDMEKARQEMKRKAFEKLPEVADSLSEHIVFIGNKYTTPNQGFYDLVNWLNGAWYAWQAAQEHMLQARYDKLSSHDYVLIPAEMSDEIAEAIAHNANCCGGIAYDIYQAIIKTQESKA